MQLSGTYFGGNGSSTPVTIRSQNDIAASMASAIVTLQAAQENLYLKIGKPQIQWAADSAISTAQQHDICTCVLRQLEHQTLLCFTLPAMMVMSLMANFVLTGKLRGNTKTQISQLFSGSSVNTSVYQSTTPVSYTYVSTGLWNAGNSFIAANRAVAALPSSYQYVFAYFPQWNFVMDNVGPLVAAYSNALDLQVIWMH